MEITFHTSCLDVLKSSGANSQNMMNVIKNEAIKAWKNRAQHEDSVRALINIPRQHGLHFHFFTVSLYRGNSNILNVRG